MQIDASGDARNAESPSDASGSNVKMATRADPNA
jgi:hypothetical protein